MGSRKNRNQKHDYFIDPGKCPKIIQMEGVETTILAGLRGEKMMMTLNTILPGAALLVHSHPHEQIGMIYGGQAILRIGDEEQLVKKGDFYYVPPNVPHGVVSIDNKPFVILDIFYPVREDFAKKVGSSGG